MSKLPNNPDAARTGASIIWMRPATRPHAVPAISPLIVLPSPNILLPS